jgi:hypothetical protein
VGWEGGPRSAPAARPRPACSRAYVSINRPQEDARLAAARAAAERERKEEEEKAAKDEAEQQQQQQPAAEAGAGAAGDGGAAAPATAAGSQQQQQPAAAGAAGTGPPAASPFAGAQPDAGASTSSAPGAAAAPAPARPSELGAALADAPPELLRQLPALLARDALSPAAYRSVATVLRLLVDVAPAHLPLVLSELVAAVAGVAGALADTLLDAGARGIDADPQLAPAIGARGGVVLRMLHALQSFQRESQARADAAAAAQQQQAAGGSAPPPLPPLAPPGGRGAGSAASAASLALSALSAEELARRQAAATSALSELRTGVEGIGRSTAPLWQALSACIGRIEETLAAAGKGGAGGPGAPGGPSGAGGSGAGGAAAAAAAAPGAAPEALLGAASRLLPPGAQQVLPLVEAFFVLCALEGSIPPPPAPAGDLLSAPSTAGSLDASGAAAGGGTGSEGGPPRGAGAASPAPSGGASGAAAGGPAGGGDGASSGAARSRAFMRFAEQHRQLLNTYLRRSPALLESSLAPLLRAPRLVDFDNKKAWFRWGGHVAVPAAAVPAQRPEPRPGASLGRNRRPQTSSPNPAQVAPAAPRRAPLRQPAAAGAARARLPGQVPGRPGGKGGAIETQGGGRSSTYALAIRLHPGPPPALCSPPPTPSPVPSPLVCAPAASSSCATAPPRSCATS